jgi:hypothetical protein
MKSKKELDIQDIYPEIQMIINELDNKSILNFAAQILTEDKYLRLIRQQYELDTPMVIDEVITSLEGFKKECERFSKIPVDTKLYKESEYLVLYQLKND